MGRDGETRSGQGGAAQAGQDGGSQAGQDGGVQDGQDGGAKAGQHDAQIIEGFARLSEGTLPGRMGITVSGPASGSLAHAGGR